MSDKVGYIGFNDQQYFKKHSQKTQRVVDEEVRRIIGFKIM